MVDDWTKSQDDQWNDRGPHAIQLADGTVIPPPSQIQPIRKAESDSYVEKPFDHSKNETYWNEGIPSSRPRKESKEQVHEDDLEGAAKRLKEEQDKKYAAMNAEDPAIQPDKSPNNGLPSALKLDHGQINHLANSAGLPDETRGKMHAALMKENGVPPTSANIDAAVNTPPSPTPTSPQISVAGPEGGSMSSSAAVPLAGPPAPSEAGVNVPGDDPTLPNKVPETPNFTAPPAAPAPNTKNGYAVVPPKSQPPTDVPATTLGSNTNIDDRVGKAAAGSSAIPPYTGEGVLDSDHYGQPETPGVPPQETSPQETIDKQKTTDVRNTQVASANADLKAGVGGTKDTGSDVVAPNTSGMSKGEAANVLKAWYASLNDQQKALFDSKTNEVGHEVAFQDFRGAMFGKMSDINKDAAKALEDKQTGFERQNDLALANHQQTLTDLQKEADQLKNKSYPDWYEKKGTGGRVLAAIAIGLGTMGSGLQGIFGKAQPNVALNIINESVAADAQHNREKYENQWKSISAKTGLENDKWAGNQFIINKQHESQAVGLEAAKMKIQALMDSTSDAESKKNGQVLKDQLDGQIATIRDQMFQHKLGVAKELDKSNGIGVGTGNPAMDKEMRGHYAQYRTGAEHRGEAVMSYPDYLKTWKTGSAATSPEGGKNALSDKAIDDQGGEAMKATVWDSLFSILPAKMAPEANIAMANVRTYNDAFLAGLARAVGDRVPVEAIEKQIASLKISTLMSDAQKQDNINRAKSFLTVMRNMKIEGRAKKEVDDDVTNAWNSM
jgi:hypothetical protein